MLDTVEINRYSPVQCTTNATKIVTKYVTVDNCEYDN